MKLILKLLLFCFFALPVAAWAQHSVSLSWFASPNAASNLSLTYNVYRLAAACPASGTSGFTKVASSIAAVTYTDTNIQPGMYCYYATASLNGAESVPSNTALALVGIRVIYGGETVVHVL